MYVISPIVVYILYYMIVIPNFGTMVNGVDAVIVCMSTLQEEPQWFQYTKLIFLEISNVMIWSAFQNQVT